MRHLLQRLAGAAAAAVLAGAGLVGAAVPAHAAACSGTSGVTVVVDFGSSTTVACAPGDPSSGIGALQAAGFSVDQVQTQPGFVCRINGSPSSDPCVRTPPKSAYWAYYHAARGGSWSYSSLGAGSYDPKPGSVEGWSFGSGGAPGTAPPAPTRTSEPTPTPKATPTRTTTTTTPRPTSGGTSSTPGSGTSDGSGSTSGGGSGSAGRSTPDDSTTARPSSRATPSRSRSATPSASPSSSASDSASALPSGSASPTDGPRLAATAATTDEGSGGGAGTLLAGGGLLLLVAGATGWTVWRRRTG